MADQVYGPSTLLRGSRNWPGEILQPEAAVSLARAANRSGYISGSDTVVCLLTSHSLKYHRESRDQAELETVGDKVELARAIEKDLTKYA